MTTHSYDADLTLSITSAAGAHEAVGTLRIHYDLDDDGVRIAEVFVLWSADAPYPWRPFPAAIPAIERDAVLLDELRRFARGQLHDARYVAAINRHAAE